MKIVVYSTSVCPKCGQLKDFLKSRGKDFEEVNLMEQRQRMAELQQIAPGTSAVPVMVLYHDSGEIQEVVHGFDEMQVEKLLA